jgi:hypothetical protein
MLCFERQTAIEAGMPQSIVLEEVY